MLGQDLKQALGDRLLGIMVKTETWYQLVADCIPNFRVWVKLKQLMQIKLPKEHPAYSSDLLILLDHDQC